MGRIAERDEYQVGSLVNGLPTCTFPPKPYHRVITNIVLGNSTSSSVACYRGVLGSTPVAQNLVGANQTMRGEIRLPAGQAFFVQWSAVGSSVRDAFARLTLERADSPLEASVNAGQEWEPYITSLVIPSFAGPGDTQILIGQDIPSEIEFDGDGNAVIGVIIWRYDANTYYFEAMSNDGAGIELRWTGIVNLDATVDVVTWMSRMTIGGGGLATAEASLTVGDSANGPGNASQFPFRYDFRYVELLQGFRNGFPRHICAESEGYNAESAADNTNSATYVDMVDPVEIPFYKHYDDSRIKVTMQIGCYVDTANSAVFYGVDIDGTDYDVTRFFFNNAFTHLPTCGTEYISGVSAGTYTIVGRWRLAAGAGPVRRDSNDWVSVHAEEVTGPDV